MRDDMVEQGSDNTAYPDRDGPVFPIFEDRADRETDTWAIAEGATVYATDGEKLGTVRTYNPQAGYLDIKRGWLFTKDVYVPLDRVDAATEDGITLKLTKDELADERYSSPPTPRAATLEPVVLTDGTVVGTGETTKGTASDDDNVFERSTGTSLTDMPDREGRPVG